MDDLFFITGDEGADRLLAEDPLALMIGMLLDQQVTMELAFRGPQRLRERLEGVFTAEHIAGMPDDDLATLFASKPALHRFPGAMAARTQQLCRHLVTRYDGDAAAVWRTADDADELLQRLEDLPGYGAEKARIFLAVLGKRLGAAPSGWREAAAPFGDDNPRSVADAVSPDALEQVRAWKRQQKAAKRSKAD